MPEQQAFWGTHRDTLEEARRQVAHGRDAGVTCPCCGQFAKVYRRKITSSMALALLELERHARGRGDGGDGVGDWVHLFSFLSERGVGHSDAPALRHWGLIEGREGEREDGNPSNGHYRITLRGRSYARQPDALLPRYVLIYNNERLGMSDEMTTIRKAMGDRFNYEELLAR